MNTDAMIDILKDAIADAPNTYGVIDVHGWEVHVVEAGTAGDLINNSADPAFALGLDDEGTVVEAVATMPLPGWGLPRLWVVLDPLTGEVTVE